MAKKGFQLVFFKNLLLLALFRAPLTVSEHLVALYSAPYNDMFAAGVHSSAWVRVLNATAGC